MIAAAKLQILTVTAVMTFTHGASAASPLDDNQTRLECGSAFLYTSELFKGIENPEKAAEYRTKSDQLIAVLKQRSTKYRMDMDPERLSADMQKQIDHTRKTVEKFPDELTRIVLSCDKIINKLLK